MCLRARARPPKPQPVRAPAPRSGAVGPPPLFARAAPVTRGAASSLPCRCLVRFRSWMSCRGELVDFCQRDTSFWGFPLVPQHPSTPLELLCNMQKNMT